MSDEMNHRARTILSCLIIAVVFVSCSETITNPNTPGSGLLTRDVVIRDTVLNVVSDTTFLQRIIPDGILSLPLEQNLVGKSGNTKAYSVIRFVVGPARDTINIISAKMVLRLVTWGGDSSGTFAFNVYNVNNPWSEGSLTWDTVNASGFYDASSIKGTHSSTIGPDTQFISVPLDTAMVRGWYQTSTTTNNGVILVPTSASSIIRGIHAFAFDSVQFQPHLEVIARNVSGTVTDTTTFETGNDTYAADISPFTLNPQRILTQAGIAYRGRMSFNISGLPRGAIINSAELLLERDPALTNISKFTAAPQPIVQALFSTDSTNFEAFSSSGVLKSGTANTFSFDVRRQVQLWENGVNYGLILRQPTINENSTLDVFSFYSNDATDPTLRPRIMVKYSVFQN